MRKTIPIFVKTISNLRKIISNLFKIILLIILGVSNTLIYKPISRRKNAAFFFPKSLLRKRKEVHALLAERMDFLVICKVFVLV